MYRGPRGPVHQPLGWRALLREDIETAIARDPAARTTVEVVLAYPGLHALWVHRVSHAMWLKGHHLAARLLSQLSRAVTGVEIHPGATIGRRFFIDHGMGVVIGETTEIHDDVTLYQGVTLGGRSLEKVKRHPTLEDGVVVGSGARVLGAITIGKEAQVGANAVVIRDVPPGAVVVGVPGRIRERGTAREKVAPQPVMVPPAEEFVVDPAIWI